MCNNFNKTKIILEQPERRHSEDTPRRFMITHTIRQWLGHIGSQVKRRQGQSYKFKEFRQNFKFLNFETNITRDTPSEVAWLDVQI